MNTKQLIGDVASSATAHLAAQHGIAIAPPTQYVKVSMLIPLQDIDLSLCDCEPERTCLQPSTKIEDYDFDLLCAKVHGEDVTIADEDYDRVCQHLFDQKVNPDGR